MSSLFYDAVGVSHYRPIASDLEGNTRGTPKGEGVSSATSQLKFKKRRFCRHDYIISFTRFALLLKSVTEIG